jgi:AcrR family transcriptional regulator
MDKESRKQQILQCACTLFAQQGYDATSVAQIAKQCNCSSPLVIRYFGSKDNLYNALLEQLRQACRKPLLAAVPTCSTTEQLEALYHTLIYETQSFDDAHAELLSALQSRSGTQDARAEAMRCMQDVGMEILLPILQEGVKDGTFPAEFACERVARILWLYVNGTYAIRANYPTTAALPFSVIRRLLLNA